MEKCSLLTKLAKCTLNIALKLTFSVDNADLSQLSDYAVEVFYQFFLKAIK